MTFPVSGKVRPASGAPSDPEHEEPAPREGVRLCVMMTAELTPEQRPPVVALEALVAEYGLIRVALALAALMARPRRRRMRAWDADLPDRVRRDIGLEPLPRGRNWWEL